MPHWSTHLPCVWLLQALSTLSAAPQQVLSRSSVDIVEQGPVMESGDRQTPRSQPVDEPSEVQTSSSCLERLTCSMASCWINDKAYSADHPVGDIFKIAM